MSSADPHNYPDGKRDIPVSRTDHLNTLQDIRQQMENVANEYAAGKLNPAQFNAIYRHYIEKRMIIEKLVDRDPETDAWRSVAQQGKTSFLRTHFESHPKYFVVFRNGNQLPLYLAGKISSKVAHEIHRILKAIWKMSELRKGIARKNLGDGNWLVLIIGDLAMTITIFALEPSKAQINSLQDMHADFERANQLALKRKLSAKTMVFPQRSLLEE